jgi:CDGSH iron-sulfur domain-containing protein 3
MNQIRRFLLLFLLNVATLKVITYVCNQIKISSMDTPTIAQKAPYVMELTPGTYAWCACGKSSKQPYCDGSHKDTTFKPHIETITEARKVAWCGCKQSGNKPFCDGTHRNL